MFIELKIEPVTCVGCGVCIDSCPTDVINWSLESGTAVAEHIEDCQGCFLCVFDCPVDAISIRQRRVPLQEIWTAWHGVKPDPVGGFVRGRRT